MTSPSTTTEALPRANRTGRVLKIAGLVVIVGLAVLGSAMWQGFKALARMDCTYNLVHIGAQCRLYAAEHGGRFPASWVELNFVGESSNLAKLFRCPSTSHEIGPWAKVDLWSDYRLIPGRTTNDPPDTVLAIEPLANHGATGGNVLFVDGSAQWWPMPRILGEQTSGR